MSEQVHFSLVTKGRFGRDVRFLQFYLGRNEIHLLGRGPYGVPGCTVGRPGAR
jgi:hypothetical protein